MNQVFLKSKFAKTTKLQNRLEFPEILNLGNLEERGLVSSDKLDLLENGELCWSLITEHLSPLGDFLREKVKFVREIVLDESDDNPIFIRASNMIHNLIVLKPGVRAVIVFNGDNACLLGSEIFLGVGANLKVVLMQNNCADFNFSAIKTRLDAGANIEWFLNYCDSDNCYSFIQNHLVGQNAEANINLCAFTKENQVTDLFIGNCFDARSCKGQILAKGVAADKSKLAFVGEIDITLQGGGTDSFLKEDVLMLDAEAKIDAVPSLEIKTNDVKAGHGVAVSRLNADRLFYLTSRGISNEEARKLVLSGFLRDLYSRAEIKDVVERMDWIIG